MVAKKKAAIKDDAAAEESLSTEIWNKNVCSICQDVCSTRDAKLAHCKSPRHRKKRKIFNFLTKDATQLTMSGKASQLLERYKDKGNEQVGLECIHELMFPFAESGWWACSICYDAGFNYDQVDEHLNSVHHLQCFVDEFHPAKAKKMDKGWSQTERLEFLLDAKKQIHYEQTQRKTTVSAPEIIDLSTWTLHMARTKLEVDDCQKDYVVQPLNEDSNNVIIQCQICHETLPCRKEYVEDGWRRHKDTERHSRLLNLTAILRQYNFERVQEEDRLLSELSEETIRWKRVDSRVYGPVCGIKHLRRMGKTSLCSLCGVVAEDVDEHFASEHHLIRFVCTQQPREGWQMVQASRETRREKLLAMLQSTPRENEESQWTKEACPSRLTWIAVESEAERLPSFPPPQEPFGFNSACLVCPMCWQSLPTPTGADPDAVWNEHVFTHDHLDFAARRYTIEYDDAYLVPVCSSVQLLPKESHGQWKTETVEDQVTWKYQTQTDVGLEYVVEDVDERLVVCTLCARSYPLGENCQMGRHVRSMQHLMQYLHVTNRAMLSMVLDTKPETACDELILEWLQRNVVSAVEEIRVFNNKKTKDLQSWPNIKIRTMQMAPCPSDIRPIYDCVSSMVDHVANDKEEHRTLSAREALQSSGMKEIVITRMALAKTGLALFRCAACDMCFVVSPSQLEHDVWEKHIGSEDHLRRALAFANHKFDPLYFTPLSSTYTVKPFVQKDPTKKVTWRWNPLDKSHDLVLAIVGLEELVEKKSEESMLVSEANVEDFTAHFFCRVCAVVVGRRAQMLEDHVRSATHVYAYVNKHFPQTVLELERLDNNDGGKERRKIIATLLKDIKPPAEYCIPVYDPIGESERRQKEAEVKQKQREAMRKNEEMRQKAMEERKKKDEERKKTKEEEQKREREREEERKRREAVVMEKHAAITAERERLHKIAVENAALAEIARKNEERTLAQNQLTRDPAIAALLSTKQAISAQLEALRAAKAGGAPPEPKLIIPGPNQLSQPVIPSLPTVRISGGMPQPQSVMGGMMQPPNMTLPPPGMFSIPPPMGMGVPPPSSLSSSLNPFSMPPPSMMAGPSGGGSMSVPPPSLMTVPPPSMHSMPPPSVSTMPGIIDLVGPKPVLSSFVPKVDAMPVYPSSGGSIGGGGATLRRKADFDRPSLNGASPDLYASNGAIITNRQALVDYMWKQGNEEIPERERPARFSRLCAATPGCLGMEYIYEVVCLDSGELTTMYCSMCGYWSTPMDTVKHMQTPSHRLSYLFRNYKLYHRTVESEVDQRAKEILLEQFAMQIRSRDNPPPCITHRLKCYLNAATIQRLWPQYVTILDQSWRTNPVCRTPSPPIRRGRSSRSRSYSSDSRSRSYSRSRSPSPKDRYRRSRSRDRDGHRRRSRSRSPRHGRERRRKSYSRSRSGSPVMKTWQPETMGVASSGNGPMMGMGTGMGGMGVMTSPSPYTAVPPPSIVPAAIIPNMTVPPPTVPRPVPAPVGVPLPKPAVITIQDDEDMHISTTPPPVEKKKEERRDREREREKEKERERGRGRDKESKSSTPRKERSRSKDRSSRRDSGRREREKKEEKEVDPVREEQRKKALEKVKALERQKKEQKLQEREKKIEATDERMRRDRRERSRERKRSVSPVRKRRRSDSRERRTSYNSTNGGEGEKIDWEARAAAFLAKIGDMNGASQVIQGTGSSSQQTASASPYAVPAPSVYSAAPTGRPGSGMGGAVYEPLVEPVSDFGMGGGGKRRSDREISSPVYEPIYDESSSSAGPSGGASDDAETKRKLLGVLVTMQKETEAGRELSEKDVDRIYKEVGLSSHGEKNSELLAQLIEVVGGGKAAPTKRTPINLEDYGIGAGSSPAQQRGSPAQHHASPYYGASSSRGPPPPPHPTGYGSASAAVGGGYGGSPRDTRPITSLAGIDAGDLELLKNLRSTLKLMQTMTPSAGPRSLPMPPGYGRQEYDRREPYPPPSSVYPPYRSPVEEDPRLRRLAYEERDRYADPRADPRLRDRYPPDPRSDPRYRGYYDEVYERAPPPPSAYGGVYDRDPRGLRPAMDPREMRDPRDTRDPRDARDPRDMRDPRDSRDPRDRPSMGDARLYEPPPPRAERPVLTREEYEARLRGDIPPTQPTGSLPKPSAAPAAAPTAPTAPTAPPPTASAVKQPSVVTIDDDDDWGALEQILDKKMPTAPATAAPPTGSRQSPQMPAKGGAPPQSTAAGASPAAGSTMTAAEAQKEENKRRAMEGIARVRQQWGVKNKAEPAPQPHLARQPPQILMQTSSHTDGVAMGGQWDAAYVAPQRPTQQQQYQQPQHQQQAHLQQYQQQHHQQQQQQYSGHYGQNGGGYHASYDGGYY